MAELAKCLDDASTRQAALQLVTLAGDRQAVLELVRRLQTADRAFLPEIVRVLGELKAGSAAEPVLTLIRAERRNVISSSNLPLVFAACLTLGRVGGDAAKAYLAGWLRTEGDYRLQLALIPGLAEFRDPSLGPVFSRYRASPSSDVRRAATAALSALTNNDQR